MLRTREFLMKDSYSFDLDEAGLEKSYKKHIEAYDRIFHRCGLEIYRVESDSGFMGGAQAHEYIAPSPAGEDRIALCEACGYAANVEMARSLPRVRDSVGLTSKETGPREVATPEKRTIEEISAFLQVPPHLIIKALVYMAGNNPVMALVRGDHVLEESKLARYVRSEVRPALPEEVREATGAEIGFVGPVNLRGARTPRLVADESLRPGKGEAGEGAAGGGAAGGEEGPGTQVCTYVTGANKPHSHLVGVMVGRDFQPEYADLRQAEEGDGCPVCGAPLTIKEGIEVANIFKLGTKYSEALGATVLDEEGRERVLVMGSYGIGPARIAAAAVEQLSDDRGIVWPKAIAPFDVHLVQVQAKDPEQSKLGLALHDALEAEGWEVLWDDREERPGFKFADADLIGCPVQITVGKKAAAGVAEIRPRRRGEWEEIKLEECSTRVRQLWEDTR